ncbi:flagellar biosynthesis regulator FlaF [Phenylobacterium sp.]|uniref:flagellar biosynthesis regulator FlaF n=1 Tax=Phenylobacterium sp. TaxID=1871053 RepID=UPI00286B7C0C|nr:flagellar biosynthesis regulator FlaF [Phenylobacterium sp.]
MSLRAYQQTAARAESGRELEYRLFGQVTRALIEAAALDPSEVSARADALDWNRRLWATLAGIVAEPDNALPAPLKAQIISIGIWVGKYTSMVIRREDDDIQALIDVNRAIMQGLSGAAAEAA